ncbi:MAG: hypothetical protein J0H49_06705 [Acidobacteria bacterium]|nr:hypothetical protein [Acidobacteriota bacterium]
MSRTSPIPARLCGAFLFLMPLALGQTAPAAGQVQSYALTDARDLTGRGVKLEPVEYLGRKAVRVTTDETEDGLAFFKGLEFQDGTIDLDLAVKPTTPPGVRMPGFLGLAFRARTDGAHYELFYLRPGNSSAEDQAMRNHSVQYSAGPDFGWYRLRRMWPWVYEAHADLALEKWIHVKLEVSGRRAKLFVNGSSEPALVVDGLKGEDLKGQVALWGYAGEESYFSNLKVTHAKAQPLSNGGEAGGEWTVKCTSDSGVFQGLMKLERAGGKVKGTWTGSFGSDLPVEGTWRDGYVELTLRGEWKPVGPKDPPGAAVATLAGWIDGNTAKGRMKVADRADGQWMAERKQ